MSINPCLDKLFQRNRLFSARFNGYSHYRLWNDNISCNLQIMSRCSYLDYLIACNPNKGHGTKFMKRIIGIHKIAKTSLILKCFQGTDSYVHEWYHNLGFSPSFGPTEYSPITYTLRFNEEIVL